MNYLLALGPALPAPFHHDSNWDSFFNGHADNIEKDIHSLSRGTDDATDPPEYQQSEDQGEEAEEEGQSPAYVSQLKQLIKSTLNSIT